MENNQINDITNIKTFKSAWYQTLKEVRGVDNTWSIACSKLIESCEELRAKEKELNIKLNKIQSKKAKDFYGVRNVMISFCQWLDSHNKEFLMTDKNFRRRFRQFKNTVSHHNTLDVVGLTWETPIAKMNGHFKRR